MNRRKFDDKNIKFLDRMLQTLIDRQIVFNAHTLDDRSILITWYGDAFQGGVKTNDVT